MRYGYAQTCGCRRVEESAHAAADNAGAEVNAGIVRISPQTYTLEAVPALIG